MNLLDLPDEVLCNALEGLPLHSLAAFAASSRESHRLSRLALERGAGTSASIQRSASLLGVGSTALAAERLRKLLRALVEGGNVAPLPPLDELFSLARAPAPAPAPTEPVLAWPRDVAAMPVFVVDKRCEYILLRSKYGVVAISKTRSASSMMSNKAGTPRSILLARLVLGGILVLHILENADTYPELLDAALEAHLSLAYYIATPVLHWELANLFPQSGWYHKSETVHRRRMVAQLRVRGISEELFDAACAQAKWLGTKPFEIDFSDLEIEL